MATKKKEKVKSDFPNMKQLCRDLIKAKEPKDSVMKKLAKPYIEMKKKPEAYAMNRAKVILRGISRELGVTVTNAKKSK